MIEVVGDWVEINDPSRSWFHGEIAEVVAVYEWNPSRYVVLALSRTPSHSSTVWPIELINTFPESNYAKAVEVLGEDYFG